MQAAAEEPEGNWEVRADGAEGKQGPGTGTVALLLPMVGVGWRRAGEQVVMRSVRRILEKKNYFSIGLWDTFET